VVRRLSDTYLIKDVNKGQGIIALQRHRSVHALLGCQHLREGGWKLPGPYVNGRELREEGILEC